MYDVITVGSNTLDVFAYTERTKSICVEGIKDGRCYVSYPIGSKLLIDELDFYTGGGGTNSAVCLSRLGMQTAYLGKVGSDNNSESIEDILKRESIDFIGSRTKDEDEKTGFSVVLDSIQKRRTILAYKGANNTLSFKEIDENDLETRWFYFASMSGKSFEILERLSDFSRENDIKIHFNPSNYLTERGSDYLGRILENTHTLILNDEEASDLVGKGGKEKKLKGLRSLGPDIVVVTEGSDEVVAMDKDDNLYKARPPQVEVVEATGAGDCFSSTFLASYIRDGDIKKAIRLGITHVTSILKYKGAKNKLLGYEELMELTKDFDIRVN